MSHLAVSQHINAATKQSAPQITLESVTASIEFALIQIDRGLIGSAREILGEAMREAQGAPLDVH